MSTERSLARLFNELVLLCRRMCEHCHGQGKVPTPAMAAWEAEVERYKADILADTGARSEQAAYDTARRQAGPAPEPTTAQCKGCDGRGYRDTELSLDELASLLGLPPSGEAA